MFALADCNNFYCSCERVFRPDLEGKPVAVLSNNDGCVIARSNEVKALGIAMGAPYFQVEDQLKAAGATIFSSNYELYGSLSARVMSLLAQATPRLIPYSIDEAFLDFTHLSPQQAYTQGLELVRRVRRAVGIPISIGIAPTVTLAKMASKFAKKYPAYHGCCLMDTDEKRQKALTLFPIQDVWGIGRKLIKQFHYLRIDTAADLANQSEEWVRSRFNLPTLRTWMELRGVSCIDPSERTTKQSICISRSFPAPGINDPNTLQAVLAAFATRCAEKLRKQNSCCHTIMVFVRGTQNVVRTTTLPVVTQDTAEIVGAAVSMVRQDNSVTVNGNEFCRQAGIMLTNIVPAKAIQQDLFDTNDRSRQQRLNDTIDRINRHTRRDLLHLAATTPNATLDLFKREHVSPCYTTRISDILTIKV